MGGGGKNSGQTIGYRYYMSVHMGLARGALDEIVQINAGDVRAWPIPDGNSEVESGVMLVAEGPEGKGVRLSENGVVETVDAGHINTYRGGNGTFQIRASELFGGDKKEGGIEGTVTVLMGARNQIVPQWIKNLMGGRVPDFRGVATLFFDGLLCSMNPYPKTWAVRVRRTMSGWDGEVWQPSLATIWMRDGAIKAMNPAHIIYECLTNRDWGRGFPRTFINDTVNQRAAQQLYDEGLGLCLRWNRQSELGTFIQEVVDHAGGSLYPDPTTGLLTFELLRGDYDADTLPIFTYDSGLLSVEEEVATQDDIVNEVIVNWKDPIQNKDRQGRVHNLASLQTMQAVASNTISYNGVPTVDLALRLAQRDLKAVATSLKRYKVKLDRRAWKIKPGSVFRISAPELNIYNVIVRAGKVRKAEIKSGEIEVDAVLDVFGLPASSFIQPEAPAFEEPDRTARSITQRLVREATYRDISVRYSPDEREGLEPESGAIITAAAKPSPMTHGYRVRTRTGAEQFANRGTGEFIPVAKLMGALGVYETTLAFTDGADLGLVEIGDSVQIGDEICRLIDITQDTPSTGVITVARGAVDTIPTAHALGAPIFFTGIAGGSDGREYVEGELVEVKLLSFTSTSELSENLAPTDSIRIGARWNRPYPPADFQINGTPFANVVVLPKTDIELTWAHRNRLVIQDQLVGHTEPSTTLEPDSSYTIRVYNSATATTPVRVVSGIEDTLFVYTLAMALDDGIDEALSFELEAERDGVRSWSQYRADCAYTDMPFPLTIRGRAIDPTGGVGEAMIGEQAGYGYGTGYGTSYGP